MNTDSNQPRVTVVVPCRDQAHLLAEALESVRNQTFTSWRAMVVDSGSAAPDELQAVLTAMGDDRIEMVRDVNVRGRAAARNVGIRATASTFVLTLDPQDRLAPECLERLVAVLDERSERDAAFPDVRTFGRQAGVVSVGFPEEGKPVLDEGQLPSVSGALLRRTFLEKVGLFDEASALAPNREDFEFWVRAIATGCSVEHVADPLYERRVTYMSFFGSPLDDHVADYVASKHKQAFAKGDLHKRFRAHWYAKAARAAYQRRDRKRAFELSMRARKTHKSAIGLQEALRRFLPGSTNRAIDGGSLHRAVPLLGYPLHGKARHKPFFVIGLGHSGNALLRRILSAHSALHMPPSTWVLNACIRKFKTQGRHLSWPDLVQVILAEFQFHPEFRLLEMDLAPVAKRCSFLSKHQRNLATLFHAVYQHHAEVHGNSGVRWGDDTPLNSLDDAVAGGDAPKAVGEGVPHTLERLLQVFPDAQFLHLCRDGVEVVGSYLREGVFDDVAAGAERWLHVELQTTRFVSQHPANCTKVRCEELVAKPEETVRGLCSFLGVEMEPGMLAEPVAGIGEEYPGEARRLFSVDQRRTLQSMLGAALAERGYAPALE